MAIKWRKFGFGVMMRLSLRVIAGIALFLTFLISGGEARPVKHRMTKHHITEHSHSHFKGRGMWVWNEIHGNDNDYEPYVRMAKAYGIQYVVIKAYNGGNWGVRDAEGDFQTQLNQRMISAFQKAGIRCYGCGTAYLWPQSDVEGAIRHSVNLLHKTTVDGIVLDDVFAYGADKHQTGRLFGEIRNHIDHCSSCRKKAFAFSTFPYVWKADLPWEIPFRYARYYLPQIYWMDMRLTPSGAVSRFQRGWNEYHRKNRNVHVRIIPVGPTIDHRDVTPKHVKQFISACRKDGYHDISFFRWGVTSKEKWKVIGGKS